MNSRKILHIMLVVVLLPLFFILLAYLRAVTQGALTREIACGTSGDSQQIGGQGQPVVVPQQQRVEDVIRERKWLTRAFPETASEYIYELPKKAGSGTLEEEKDRFELFLSTQGVVCRNISHFGGHYDGRYPPPKYDPDGLWYLCLDSQISLTPGKCIVYSVGIWRDWSFDESIAEYGCKVFSFDPSIGKQDHFHSPQIQFFNLGLSHVDSEGARGKSGKDGWKTRTLRTLIKELDHAYRMVDVLKIDIELNEWTALPQMLTSGTLKKYVKQLDIEFHRHWSTEKIREHFGIIQWLDKQGFKIAHLHRNMFCRSCFEVTYINTNLVDMQRK